VTIKDAERLTREELEDKIVVGEFVHRIRPTLTEMFQAVLGEAKKR